MPFSELARLLLQELDRTQGRTDMGFAVALERTWLEVDDGGEALRVVYRHPLHGGRLGLRVLVHEEHRSPLLPAGAHLADVLRVLLQEVTDAVGEPLGRSAGLLVVDDDGVQWWGDGYPG
ncbi:hypothetical protein [Vallicoccus soli]|uniref:Uncharacterized protein n=1 Tax=Vallicoccus soli TaxID=2339232 RepID=A0A3A3YVA7_9ACTN|nr:hypothetical protein [Vallicoccus soli]RJK92978.1 hypothetical protein D5H78_17905 [Vallicoccus soli]